MPLGWSTLRSLLHHDVGADAVALFSMAGEVVPVDGVVASAEAIVHHALARRLDGAAGLTAQLREAGVRQVAMVTGDRHAATEQVGRQLGVDRVYAEQSPEQELEVVRPLQAKPELRAVMMVGDGINDAAALDIARQSVLAGMALSFVAIAFAAAGLLESFGGAVLQKVIDVTGS